MTTVDEDVEDAQVDLPSPAVHHAPAVAATTCSSQCCHDARVLPFHALGSSGLLSFVQYHAGSRVPLGHEWQLGRSLFGMPARGPSRPLLHLGGPRVAALLFGPPCKVAGGH